MNKIQVTIYITASDVDIKDKKIIVVNGEFYFQGKKYLIKDEEIVKENDKIAF